MINLTVHIFTRNRSTRSPTSKNTELEEIKWRREENKIVDLELGNNRTFDWKCS